MECAKVLVVDQEPGVYEPLKPALAKHGYEVHTTAAISRALALAGAHRYQAALLSLSLVRGTALVSDLLAEQPDVPVILVLPPDCADGLPPQVLNVTTYVLGKPLQLEALRLVLDRTLELVTLRTLVRQQRHAVCAAIGPATSQTGLGPAGRPTESLEVVLAVRLRHIIPNMSVLGGGSLYRAVLSYVEKLLLTIVLEEYRGNQIRSAEILGINRNTLRKKIRDFGLPSSRGGV